MSGGANPSATGPSQRVILALFVLSGAAGLVYEVVWARQLVLVFGNTSQAVTTILTGFFGGLALGGFLGGRIADRARRPLRLYAVLELLVVAVVLFTPRTFELVGEAYRGAWPVLETEPGTLAVVRFGLSLAALAPATVLMGATLPALTRYLTRGPAGLAGAFRRLYAANTLGAILGTALGGLVLIELLGLAGTLAVGMACSGAAGLVALVLDRRHGAGAGETTRPPTESPSAVASVAATAPAADPSPAPAARPRLALALAFASGATSLGYQVVWNRLLAAGTGSSTYVFTIILALFLAGIALGPVVLARFGGSRLPVTVLVGRAQLLTALLAAIGGLLLVSPPTPFWGTSPRFLEALLVFGGITAVVVLPATIALGVTFPATAALLGGRRGGEGASTGLLLAVNTAGSIGATVVLPFLVIPAIGSAATLGCLVIANALLATALLASAGALPRPNRLVEGLTAAVLAVAVAAGTLTGTAFRSPTLRLLDRIGAIADEVTEDEIASVVAGRLPSGPQLWVGGMAMTVITVDTTLMPLLPVMARPAAERGLVIAFGMGTSFRTSVRAGVGTDVVELVPSVPRMFRWFHADAAAVLADPRSRVVVADGRNFVELSAERYDVVVVDPPPPIESSGVSVISSLEFYEAARDRLLPGGVMMQWVPNGQTVPEFLAHVRTFLAVHPEVRVLEGPAGQGWYLLGSTDPIVLDPATVRSVLERPGILDDLAAAPDDRDRTLDDWVETIAGLEWAEGDALRALVGDGPLVTDDRPLPEYFLLRRLLGPREELLSREALERLGP